MRAPGLLVIMSVLFFGCDAEGVGRDPDGDAEVAPDGDVDVDADIDGDVEPDGDVDDVDGGDADPDEPTCFDPPGSACDPIMIDAFPFSHGGDTSEAFEAAIDAYACAPTVDERGPEIHYEIVLGRPGMIFASVVEAPDVDVDLHLLGSSDPDDCIARANTRIEQGLEAGRYRLVIDTYYDGSDLSGVYTLTVGFEEPLPELLGTMWNTFYFLANEAEHEGPQDVPIYDSECEEIARVREEFHDSVCIEGSGVLADGRVINYSSTCTSSCPAAHLCSRYSYRICYSVLDSERYPWGAGARGVALEPDRSIAVDREFVPLGTVIYFEELDGIVPPGETEPHDGCMRADDVGGAIDGNHFDFFSGTRERWLAWEEIFPTRTEFTAWTDHPRCFGM